MPPSPFSPAGESLALSVVIAVFNEAENVAAVARETLAAMASGAAKDAFEVVFVDDGSTDATVANLTALGDPRVVIVRHIGRCGKSQAVRTGVLASRGRWIGTMDGDGQNDPLDIVQMYALAQNAGGSPLVAGVRRRRHDPASRLIATRIANGLRQSLLNDGCPDTGCD